MKKTILKLSSFILFISIACLLCSCGCKDTVTSVNDLQEQEEKTEIPINSDLEETSQPTVEPQETTPEPENIRVSSISLSFYQVTLVCTQTKMPIVTMYPENSTNKGEIWTSSDKSVATVDMYGNIFGVSAGECVVTVSSQDSPEIYAEVKVVVTPEPELTYIDGILIVNKSYALPKTYAPGWETEATDPLWQMIAAAKQEGIELWMTSGYRSWADQNYIYNGYVSRDGQALADTYSARPGHSEHQTGLAYDLNDLPMNFGETEEGIWVAENCHKYGFIIRYPKDKEEITGYIYEPWHIRYLGVEKATEVYESGLCLEEFLGIDSVYS